MSSISVRYGKIRFNKKLKNGTLICWIKEEKKCVKHRARLFYNQGFLILLVLENFIRKLLFCSETVNNTEQHQEQGGTTSNTLK